MRTITKLMIIFNEEDSLSGSVKVDIKAIQILLETSLLFRGPSRCHFARHYRELALSLTLLLLMVPNETAPHGN
jgi:hypothetical protein